MALHAGEVHQDTHGYAGASINLAFRLIEAPVAKMALHDSSAVLALIVSEWFYDEVVRHHPAAEPSWFCPAHVVVKETETTAWIRVLGLAGSPPRRGAVPTAPGRTALSYLTRPVRSLPASSSGVRYTLPPDAAAFTGREEELNVISASVRRAARAGRVVAIHAIDGMPGVGKTTLAVHAAHLLRDRFPDRQLFVNLHAHTPGQDPLTPEAALAGLLTAVGIDARNLPGDLQGRASLWRDRMAGQRALLVLDNAASSDQVAPLLPGDGSCLVLVTSRRHLGDLPGAAPPVLLDVLPPDEAREMFVRLAPRATGPDGGGGRTGAAGRVPAPGDLAAGPRVRPAPVLDAGRPDRRDPDQHAHPGGGKGQRGRRVRGVLPVPRPPASSSSSAASACTRAPRSTPTPPRRWPASAWRMRPRIWTPCTARAC